MTVDCQVIIDHEPGSGTWNMAVDAMLLDAGVRDGHCTLRLYEWSEPTISLGYFQRDGDLDRRIVGDLPCVRRLSGGGAILHHFEQTYSCVVPPGHSLAVEPHRLYVGIHDQIRNCLSALGIDCEFRAVAAESAESAFLCFSRQDPNDLVHGAYKIVGSAQRRRRGAVLQHGSILWQRSPRAPQFPGVEDLVAGLDQDDLRHLLAQSLPEVLSSHSRVRVLTQSEIDQVRRRSSEVRVQ